MKTKEEINKILENIDTSVPSKYYAMTYEQGIEEALLWVLGEIPDEEFNSY